MAWANERMGRRVMAQIKVNVTVTRDNMAKVVEAIEQLATSRVMVGVPAENAFRSQEPGEPKPPPNNAELAYIHEFGEPTAHIPARPFLVPAITAMQPEAIERLKKTAEYAVNGRPDAVNKSFHALGLRAQAAVRRKITDGPFQQLAAYTIKKRLERGRTGTKPLLDTGKLRNSIIYAIRKITARLK